MKSYKGIFITFEGAEGSGKSTQIKKAASFFRKNGRRVLLLREPGGTRISEAIRNVLLNNRHRQMCDKTELLLYLAARAQVVEEKIKPALREGKVVISDRFEDSTLAYQGYGRNISKQNIEVFSRWIRGRLKPDFTILLDFDVKKGLRRGGRHDRIEKEALSFHEAVRLGYLKIAKKEPKRILCLDGSLSVKEITQKIEVHLARLISKK